jgi:hypothetical protein
MLQQNRRGGRCPRCGASLLSAAWEEASASGYTPEEVCAIVSRVFARCYNREGALDLLTACAPELRVAVADIYPLTPEQAEVAGQLRAASQVNGGA